MKVKEKTGIKNILIEEVFRGDVFKWKDEYYMNCNMGLSTTVQCVELRSGNLVHLDWGSKVELVKGEFVCQ